MARIVVAMSGGVDSSVAAALLKEQGHEVIGIMLRLWSEPALIEDDGIERVVQNKCCSLESVDDARRVARKLDIPFYLVNVEQEFKDNVVDLFYSEYVAGRTPNPCLTCNRHIRFTVLLNRALALDADYLATGHYVRVDDHPITGKRRLRRGIDRDKDQSYVLHVLNQQQLAHACFPLGPYTKSQVRAMAAERGMAVATKAESQEICFVAQNDYRGFINRYAENLTQSENVGTRFIASAPPASSAMVATTQSQNTSAPPASSAMVATSQSQNVGADLSCPAPIYRPSASASSDMVETTKTPPVGTRLIASGRTHFIAPSLPKPGPIYDQSGKTLGRHRGLAFYTIGQRKGLGITSSIPLHVLQIDAEQNALIVGPAGALEKTSCIVGKMHYVSGEVPTEPFPARVQIRYKAPEQEALVTPLEGNRVQVTFSRPQRAITPGQAAVFYGGEESDEVLCGGIIE